LPQRSVARACEYSIRRRRSAPKFWWLVAGRCNVTNEFVDATRFNTTQSDRGPKSFVARVLRSFSVEQTHRFFDSIGVPLKLNKPANTSPLPIHRALS
jgi:predicted flavoprotein YhiN